MTGPLSACVYKPRPCRWGIGGVVLRVQALGLWRSTAQAALMVETRPKSMLLLLPRTLLWLISLQILMELIKERPFHCLTGTCPLLSCLGFSELCRFPTNY